MQKYGKLQNVQQLIKYRILFIDCHMVSLKTFTLFKSLCCIGIYILISVFRLIERLLYASLFKLETTESLGSSYIILLKFFFGHKSNRMYIYFMYFLYLPVRIFALAVEKRIHSLVSSLWQSSVLIIVGYGLRWLLLCS